MWKRLKRKKIRLVLLLLLLVNLFLVYSLMQKNIASPKSSDNPSKDAKAISNKNLSFKELEKYFLALAKDKGGVHAFEVLKIASLPPNVDLHLLGHTIGDILFQQQGFEGIKHCTQDFRNACSHSIVIGAFVEKGESIIEEVKKICHEAPGGLGAYTMCFHGFGHGVLAYSGYNLEKAIDVCKKVGTFDYGNREYVECVGGTVMEMTAGVHDRETWQKQAPKYIPKDNPLAPCNTSAVPMDAKSMCYVYLTPRLFEAAGANLNSPEPEFFPKAFSYCDQIPIEQAGNRNICYGGFGKEFTVLANNRDIRDMGSMNEKQLQSVYEWCKMANNRAGIKACLGSALQSLFWGGENKPYASIKFCQIIDDSELKDSCYKELVNSITYYIPDKNSRTSLCEMLPSNYKTQCAI